VIPLTRAIPERIQVVTTMRYTNRRLLYFTLSPEFSTAYILGEGLLLFLLVLWSKNL